MKLLNLLIIKFPKQKQVIQGQKAKRKVHRKILLVNMRMNRKRTCLYFFRVYKKLILFYLLPHRRRKSSHGYLIIYFSVSFLILFFFLGGSHMLFLFEAKLMLSLKWDISGINKWLGSCILCPDEAIQIVPHVFSQQFCSSV